METLSQVSVIPWSRNTARLARPLSEARSCTESGVWSNCFDRLFHHFAITFVLRIRWKFTGTVVDKDACHPHNYDFFLVSQAGLIVRFRTPCTLIVMYNLSNQREELLWTLPWSLIVLRCVWLQCRVHLGLLTTMCLWTRTRTWSLTTSSLWHTICAIRKCPSISVS